MNCHVCGNETDFTCERCEEPVCEECCVPFTLQNQIDYALCKCCGEGMEELAAAHYFEKEDAKKKQEKEAEERRAIRRIAARKRYWTPEAIEKRRLKKVEKMECRRKQFEKAMRIVGEMFR